MGTTDQLQAALDTALARGAWTDEGLVVAGGIVDTRSANGFEWSTGDVNAVFELASVTKLLAAYACLMAVEEGVFELETPCGQEGSTVRHLLAHTSGAGFLTRQRQKAPGERRIYSSAGFEILGEALERETGMSFGEYAREGVFRPLGMESTEIYGSPGHEGRSTVADLGVFAREILSPKLLDPSTVREAMTPQFPDVRGVVPGYGMQKPCPWGLGFEIKGEKSPHWMGQVAPPETVGHFGMSGTWFWAVPEWADSPAAGWAMVVLTNRMFGEWATELWPETNTEVFRALGA
ncbi:serine hydrolase domain-containing protein [Corynebacterium aquatimens]|uniref:CubicO group peptidase (Beta-lactamase class C family) n=1 Tax=Corynebacterium aquatimens TaxID=1190508 RepID=A0A931E1R4_9CORY|nr:serine hydrolase domain-containing protein [Corynebacterium aquatimens]MBG6122050.1 CubicO group peptidase (beta-lactamase class C family) [Corynebacterium aquatimens]WJY65409.1 beta-lactam binding protein AmpH [Corynebacterium aquatimens]